MLTFRTVRDSIEAHILYSLENLDKDQQNVQGEINENSE